jgi:hypothetical protein
MLQRPGQPRDRILYRICCAAHQQGSRGVRRSNRAAARSHTIWGRSLVRGGHRAYREGSCPHHNTLLARPVSSRFRFFVCRDEAGFFAGIAPRKGDWSTPGVTCTGPCSAGCCRTPARGGRREGGAPSPSARVAGGFAAASSGGAHLAHRTQILHGAGVPQPT